VGRPTWVLVRTGLVTKFDVGGGFSVDYRSPRVVLREIDCEWLGCLEDRTEGFGPVWHLDLPAALRTAVVQNHGSGFRDWSFTNGLIGLTAGIAGYFLLEDAGPSQRVVRASIIVSLAVIVGVASTVTDLLTGSAFLHSAMAGCLPTVFNVELAAPLLLPILDQL
jgi:hypothetical protein